MSRLPNEWGLIAVASGKCAGSDPRNIVAVDMTCPGCGKEIEFFSDEPRRTCPSCGIVVKRQAVPSCAAHCESALACLGPERYKELKESGELDEILGKGDE